MGIRLYRSYTPATRNRSIFDFNEITTAVPEATLVKSYHRSKGRNNRGIITARHRGGGHKRLYRMIDFSRNKIGILAKVISIEYDPNRNARICLLHYQDGSKSYILHPRNLNVGMDVISDFYAPISVGNHMPLCNMPLGTEVHNIEIEPRSGGKISRAAGTFAQVVAKEGDYITLKLASGEIRLVHKNCWATIGQVGNVEAINIRSGKAGRTRWLGRRPHVRGSVMNPCDHPHGGGEGRAPIGRSHPVSPWGKPALGQKTRNKKRYSNSLILKRRR